MSLKKLKHNAALIAIFELRLIHCDGLNSLRFRCFGILLAAVGRPIPL